MGMLALVVAFLLLIIGAVVMVYGIGEDYVAWTTVVGMGIVVLGLVAAFNSLDIDINYAINNEPKIAYGAINDVGVHRVSVDDTDCEIWPKVSEKYPVDVTGYAVGEIVRVEYVEGSMGRYLTKLEKYKEGR
jgi:multidrug transporter EmrE-like cation transporter